MDYLGESILGEHLRMQRSRHSRLKKDFMVQREIADVIKHQMILYWIQGIRDLAMSWMDSLDITIASGEPRKLSKYSLGWPDLRCQEISVTAHSQPPCPIFNSVKLLLTVFWLESVASLAPNPLVQSMTASFEIFTYKQKPNKDKSRIIEMRKLFMFEQFSLKEPKISYYQQGYLQQHWMELLFRLVRILTKA